MLCELASLLPDHPALGESLRFQFVGFSIVMIVLTTLWLLIQFVGFFFARSAARIKPFPGESPAPASAATAPPPEIVAAIAAAVHMIVQAPHRIVSIHAAAPRQSAVNINAWSVEGRRQIFSSHSVR